MFGGGEDCPDGTLEDLKRALVENLEHRGILGKIHAKARDKYRIRIIYMREVPSFQHAVSCDRSPACQPGLNFQFETESYRDACDFNRRTGTHFER